MIENFRKYTGLMIGVLGLLFVGLIFFAVDSPSARDDGSGAGAPAVELNGQTYSEGTYQRLGSSSAGLAFQLQMGGMLEQLGGHPYYPDPQLFFANRMILRRAMETYGISPSDSAVNAFIRERSAFTSPDGTFNSEGYRNLVNNIGRLGMTEADVRSLVADSLALEELAPLIGGGLLPDLQATTRIYDADRQELTVAVASLTAESFTKTFTPSDEEIRAFWETTKKSFQTEPTIKLSYVLVGPAPTPVDPAKPAEPVKDVDPQKQAADLKISDEVDLFLVEVDKTLGKGFEEAAKKHGWAIQQTDHFSRKAVPEALNLQVRGRADRQTAADFLFSIVPTSDPLSVFSEAIPVSESQWLVARLDERVEAREMTFDEAKDQARTLLIETQAGKAMVARAKEIETEISKALAAGTSFSDAAKAHGLTATTYGPFRRNQPPLGAPAANQLFEVAQDLAPGSLAKLIELPDQSVFVFLQSREAERPENPEAELKGTAERHAGFNERAAIQAWFAQQRTLGNHKVLSRP
jgi:hypothetical protein